MSKFISLLFFILFCGHNNVILANDNDILFIGAQVNVICSIDNENISCSMPQKYVIIESITNDVIVKTIHF